MKELFLIQNFLNGLKMHPNESVIKTIEYFRKKKIGKKKLILD